MNFLTHLIQDFRQGPDKGVLPARPLTVRGIATFMFRASQVAGAVHPGLGSLLKQLNHLVTGADIAWQAKVGPHVNFFHPTGVVIGSDVVIGENCQIQDNVTLGASGGIIEGNPSVGDNVHIGCGAKILGPVHVGSDSTVGANAVVRVDVPPNSIAVGVPAVVKPKKTSYSL